MAFKEKVKIPPQALEQLIVTSGHDIRQVCTWLCSEGRVKGGTKRRKRCGEGRRLREGSTDIETAIKNRLGSLLYQCNGLPYIETFYYLPTQDAVGRKWEYETECSVCGCHLYGWILARF